MKCPICKKQIVKVCRKSKGGRLVYIESCCGITHVTEKKQTDRIYKLYPEYRKGVR